MHTCVASFDRCSFSNAKDTRVSSMRDTENLGVLVVDIHNRAAAGDCREAATAGGFLTSPDADRRGEAGTKNPMEPCAAKAQQNAKADNAPFMLLFWRARAVRVVFVCSSVKERRQ